MLNITRQSLFRRFAQLFLGAFSLAVAINAAAVGPNTVPVAGGSPDVAVTPDGYKMYVSGDSSSSAAVMNTPIDKIAQSIDVGKTPRLSDKLQRDGNSDRISHISDGYEGYPDVPFYLFLRE